VSDEMYDWARRRDAGMTAFLAGALAGLLALFLVFLLPFLASSGTALADCLVVYGVSATVGLIVVSDLLKHWM